MSGRQKLGDLIRSINYGKVTGDPEDPLHPIAKLKHLKDNCKSDIAFDELKDGYAAFEKTVCTKTFPEADTPGFDVADTTVEILLELMRDFVKEHKDKEKTASEIQFHALLELIQAGPNSSHVGLMWNFTDHAINLGQHVKGLKKKELSDLLETIYFQIKYPKNKACDEKTFFASVCARLEEIYKMISKEQYRMVPKELLHVYNLYNIQITYSSESTATPIYELVVTIIKQAGNPYLNLKHPEDAATLKEGLNILMQLLSNVGKPNNEPTVNAARLLMESIVEALFKGSIMKDYYDDIMVAITALFKHGNVDEAENVMYDVREGLLRGISGHKVPVKPLLKGSLDMILAILKRDTVSHESHLVTEDVLDIIIKRSMPASEEEVSRILKAVKGIVLCGHRDLVRKLDSVFEAMKKQKCLDWKKHIREAQGIVDAFGDVTPEKLERDYDRVFTIAVYRVFLKHILNMLKQSGLLPAVQTNLVSSFFKNVQDSTLLKVPIAQTSSDPDFMDFTKDQSLRLEVLKKCEKLLKDKALPWDEDSLIAAISKILNSVATSYKGNGRNVSSEENDIFVSIFKTVGDGGKSVLEQWYQKDNEGTPNINLEIWTGALKSYIDLHQKSATLACISAVMPNVVRWATIAVSEEHDDMINFTISLLCTIGQSPPPAFKSHIADLLVLLLKSEKCQGLYDFIKQMYPHNPGPVHGKLQDVFDSLDHFQDIDMENIYMTLLLVSEQHPEVFSKSHIKRMFERTKSGNQQELIVMLRAMKNVAEKHAENLAEFYSQLCDEKVFEEETMDIRSSIFASIGGVNKSFGEKSVDYLMKHAFSSTPPTVRIVVTTLHSMLKSHKDFMQKYKSQLEKLEQTSKDSQVKDTVHEIVLVLEGKTFENVVGEVQQQREDITALDEKVDSTVDTVVTIGGKVVEHDKEIGELGKGLEKVEEKVEEVDEGLGETKVKVEEIDKKTMSNAPKWSRDLTKLMNPSAEKDWRLLASRLGYSKADIRAWATQHDPCMALLSEWYATHKTSEATYGVLTALTEMDRKDGVAIVENAMKAAEGVVEDEDFKYPSPPPVFISYQWGIQNEVKLLKQHLNMAGYECWMDVGQMGGGDKLFAKIDNGIRGAKVMISCVTEKYAESPNCNREVNLAVNLNKPIIPLLMEKTDWPPKGSMGPIFSEYLFIRFFQRGGEESNVTDKRYWPIPKFQELLMQLNFYVVPDQKKVQKEYKNWWIPIVEDIDINKSKQQKQTSAKSQQQDSKVSKNTKSPLVFISYQWGKQAQIKELYKRLNLLGYTVWMDIFQMGGGDSLYDKIDRGIRGCKVVVSCITEKYTLSANCRREVSLADALKKPIIPLLLERMKWPPSGPMSMVFTEMLFINFYRNEAVQMTWTGDTFDELKDQLDQNISENSTSVSHQEKQEQNIPKTSSYKDNSRIADNKMASKEASRTNKGNKSESVSDNNRSASDDQKSKEKILGNKTLTPQTNVPKEQNVSDEERTTEMNMNRRNTDTDQLKSTACNIL